MIAEETLKKIKGSRSSPQSGPRCLCREYQSRSKGRGMEFSQLREYQPGTIRASSTGTSLRAWAAFMSSNSSKKKRTDHHPGLSTCPHRCNSSRAVKAKKRSPAELSALIAFTALLTYDKVGLLLSASKSNGISRRKGPVPSAAADPRHHRIQAAGAGNIDRQRPGLFDLADSRKRPLFF